jgi:hypothetical protein
MNSWGDADVRTPLHDARNGVAEFVEGVLWLGRSKRGLRRLDAAPAQSRRICQRGFRRLHAMSESAPPHRTLAPGDFCVICRTIFGQAWRRDLAATLELELEMISDWAAGRAPVPYAIVKILASFAQYRSDELSRISERLTNDLNAWLARH